MNSRFMREIADDLWSMRREYSKGSKMELLLTEASSKLHAIAAIREKEDVDKTRKDSGKQ